MITGNRSQRHRVTADDLSWAAAWLLAYEGEDGVTAAATDTNSDDPFVRRARRVAAWLDAEVNRRQRARAHRTLKTQEAVQ